jgi:hypothetical protein
MYIKYQYRRYNYTESHIRQSLSLSNFFSSENIGVKHSLSLSNFFDSDNECLNSILEYIF